MGVFYRNNNWWIDYYFNGKRKREKVGPSKRLAEIVLKKRLVEIAEGKYLDIKKIPQITFNQMAEKYLEWSKANKRSWKTDFYSIKNLMVYFAGKKLNEISTFMIEGFKAHVY